MVDARVPIGGLQMNVKANQRVEPQCEVTVEDRHVTVRGSIKPPLANVPITVAIRSQSGGQVYGLTATATDGTFAFPDNNSARGKDDQLLPGKYTVDVLVTAGGDAAETECPTVSVLVE
jgi:hypothetical protein